MQEMHAYALGLADETGALLDKVRKEGQKARRGREPTVLRLLPRRPPSNTGVTTTKTRTRKGGNDAKNAR